MVKLEEEGALTPENLVEVSRSEDAVLHNEFTWDDAKAAEEFRKVEARDLIRSIIVIPDEESIVQEPVRAFFKISDRSEHTYENVFTILTQEEKQEKLRAQAYSELKAYSQKYTTILQVTGADELIYEAEKKLATQTA
jgi:hypothetical protein